MPTFSARARVLVIDDEQGMRDMLAFELRQDEFDVVTAESGMAAIESAKVQKFDLAITDLKMPGMDGVETLEALKSLDPDIEVVVATGYATVDTAISCMKKGAYDYIQKPFDLTELRLIMDRALEKKHLSGIIALYEAGGNLLATLNHTELVRSVLELSQKTLKANSVGLVLKPADAGEQELHRLSGLSQPSSELLSLIASRGLSGGEPVRTPAVGMAELSDRCEEECYVSSLCYPLKVRDKVLGALVLLRKENQAVFSSFEQQEGTVLATQVALSLDNARLYGELEDKIEELVTTRDNLVRAEKLAMAAQLAGAVAHEVNNPLGFIRANLSALGEYTDDFRGVWKAVKATAERLKRSGKKASIKIADELLAAAGDDNEDLETRLADIGPVLEECFDGIGRIASLVTGFTHLAKPPDPIKTEHIDVSSVVKEVVEPLASSDDAGFRGVQSEIFPSGQAEVARQDLEMALANLLAYLRSTRKAGAVDTQVPIFVRVHDAEGRPSVELSDPTLRLTEEQLTRIFDPRIDVDTTDGQTMRLDIGLAIAHQILQRNNAALNVLGGAGEGTTFQILLSPPRTEPHPNGNADRFLGGTP